MQLLCRLVTAIKCSNGFYGDDAVRVEENKDEHCLTKENAAPLQKGKERNKTKSLNFLPVILLVVLVTYDTVHLNGS